MRTKDQSRIVYFPKMTNLFTIYSQCTAQQVLIVQLLLEQLCAKKLLQMERKYANPLQVVPKHALLDFVMLWIFVKMVIYLKLIAIKHHIILVTCAVTSDCSTIPALTSCKELTDGGSLTCQSPSTCLATDFCGHGEYCTSADICFAAGSFYNIS